MLTTEEILKQMKKFQALPAQVQDFVISEDVGEVNRRIFNTFKLTKEEHDAVLEILRQVYVKDLPLADFPKVVAGKVRPEVAKQLTIDLAGNILLPVADFLGDVEGLLKNLGADPNKFQVKRVQIRELTAREAAAEVAVEFKTIITNQRLQIRFQEVIESRLRGVRDDLETKNVFTRSEKLGGLALNEQVADKVIVAIRGKLASIRLRLGETTTTSSVIASPALLEGLGEAIPPKKDEIAAAPAAPRNDGSVTPEQVPDNLPVALPPPPLNIRGGKGGVTAPGSDDSLRNPSLPPLTLRGGVTAPSTPTPVVPITETPSPKKGDVYSAAEEEREIVHISKEMAKQISPAMAAVADLLSKYTQTVIKESGMVFADPVLAKRFEIAVEARLKDVRDQMETREFFLKPKEAGGLGFKDEEAKRVLDIIEKKFREFEADRLAEAGKAKAEWQRSEEEAGRRREEEKKRKEQEDLDRRFAEMGKKSGKFKAVLPQQPVAPSSVTAKPSPSAIANLPKADEAIPPKKDEIAAAPAAPRNDGSVTPEQVPDNLPVALPPSPLKIRGDERGVMMRSKDDALHNPTPPPLTLRGGDAPPSRPPPSPPPPPPSSVIASPPPSVIATRLNFAKQILAGKQSHGVEGDIATAPAAPRNDSKYTPPSPAERPKVEDVTFAPKLVGPIEELGRTMLVDFRRLSKDPKEAVLKIRDKFDLITEEGHEKRVKAIAAWQNSEVNKLYLEILHESISKGKAVAAVLAERAAQNQPTLSADEFRAIMDLNKTLRF